MTLPEIATLRLRNQQIEGSKFQSVKELVGWMGGMQAQDFAMAKWAVGIRLPHSTEKTVEEAYNQGKIIRTHLMRPTWHFVSANDIYWMLELTAPQIRKIMKTNDRRFELNDAVYAICNRMLEQVLSDGQSLMREELVMEFDKIHIRTDENRLSHIMVRAELDGVVCSGPMKGNKLTYSLLSDRVPSKKHYSHEEALATMASRYFTSHCPASLRDFVWWSGLSITNARKGLEAIKPGLISESIGKETYWMTNSFTDTAPAKPSVHLLPSYDEFLIAYADRAAALEAVHNKKIISNNGIFRPIIVVNGQVVGLWKRITKKDTIFIEVTHFNPFNTETVHSIEQEASRYGTFLNKKTELLIG